MRGARELGVAQAPLWAPADRGAAAAELDVGGVRLQKRRRDRPDALSERPCGEQGRASADRHAAARPGASAIGHHGGVAGEHRDVVEGNVEHVGDDLRERRVSPLALIGDADERRDRAAGLEAYGRSFLARDRRAPDAVELRARAGELDEAREPDSHVTSRGASRPLLPP